MTCKTNLIFGALIGAIVLFGVGCTSIKKRVNRQTVFSDGFGRNNRELMMANFAKIEIGKTTLAELHNLGFGHSKNVKVLAGANAFRELLGQEIFRNINPDEFQKLLPDLSRYTMYQVPWTDVATVSDRFFLNKQKIEKNGYDVLLTVILYDKRVVYRGSVEVKNESIEYREALFSGIIDLVNEFARPVGGAMRAIP